VDEVLRIEIVKVNYLCMIMFDIKCLYIYIYIYIERERERRVCVKLSVIRFNFNKILFKGLIFLSILISFFYQFYLTSFYRENPIFLSCI
jgi:hypothetical protein